jgi:hypothetical protein
MPALLDTLLPVGATSLTIPQRRESPEQIAAALRRLVA